MPQIYYPRNFRPKAKGGAQILKPCHDCRVVDLFNEGGCPAITIFQETFSTTYLRKTEHVRHSESWRPTEETVLYHVHKQQQKAETLGCGSKPLLLESIDECTKMIENEFHPKTKEQL